MAESEAKAGAAAAESVEERDLLDDILTKGLRLPEERRDWGEDLIKELVEQLLDPGTTVKKDTLRTIEARMKKIDELISTQLDEIMHHPDFQKLEGSWRGLQHLVFSSETGESLKIRLLNASKKDMLQDLERAVEFDMSALFKKVYTSEFDQFGGTPYGAIIGDYEFTNHPNDISLLQLISNVAAAAHAPFISAAAPQLLGLESFTHLHKPRDLAKIFDAEEYAKWKSFRESEDSRYVALTLPRTLARLPYGEETRPVDEFDYEERVSDHDDFTWSNAAYAYGANLTASFAKSGWLAQIRGVENGGLVEGLPAYTFKSDDGTKKLKCPTEIAIPDRRENELNNLGFIGLLHKKGTDKAAFFGANSCNKPKKYDTDEANANARLSANISNLLCTSRFAHYLRAIARDKVGNFMEESQCEDWLNRWITNYVCGNPATASDEAKAEQPLAGARIDVESVPGKPGHYTATAFLRPHFQLEELDADLCLVADLPEAKG